MSVDNKIVVCVNKFSSYAVFRVTIDVIDGYGIYRTNWTKFWLQTTYVRLRTRGLDKHSGNFIRQNT